MPQTKAAIVNVSYYTQFSLFNSRYLFILSACSKCRCTVQYDKLNKKYSIIITLKDYIHNVVMHNSKLLLKHFFNFEVVFSI